MTGYVRTRCRGKREDANEEEGEKGRREREKGNANTGHGARSKGHADGVDSDDAGIGYAYARRRQHYAHEQVQRPPTHCQSSNSDLHMENPRRRTQIEEQRPSKAERGTPNAEYMEDVQQNAAAKTNVAPDATLRIVQTTNDERKGEIGNDERKRVHTRGLHDVWGRQKVPPTIATQGRSRKRIRRRRRQRTYMLHARAWVRRLNGDTPSCQGSIPLRYISNAPRHGTTTRTRRKGKQNGTGQTERETEKRDTRNREARSGKRRKDKKRDANETATPRNGDMPNSGTDESGTERERDERENETEEREKW